MVILISKNYFKYYFSLKIESSKLKQISRIIIRNIQYRSARTDGEKERPGGVAEVRLHVGLHGMESLQYLLPEPWREAVPTLLVLRTCLCWYRQPWWNRQPYACHLRQIRSFSTQLKLYKLQNNTIFMNLYGVFIRDQKVDS